MPLINVKQSWYRSMESSDLLWQRDKPQRDKPQRDKPQRDKPDKSWYRSPLRHPRCYCWNDVFQVCRHEGPWMCWLIHTVLSHCCRSHSVHLPTVALSYLMHAKQICRLEEVRTSLCPCNLKKLHHPLLFVNWRCDSMSEIKDPGLSCVLHL